MIPRPGFALVLLLLTAVQKLLRPAAFLAPRRPNSARIGIPRQAVPIAIVLLLGATACASSSSPDSTQVAIEPADTASSDPETSTSETGDPETGDPEAGESAEPTQEYDLDAPLVKTTDTDAPFDLTGGAETSDDGVTLVTNDPRDDLESGAASVSGLWPTDWSRRTIDLGELLPGLRGEDTRDGIPPIDRPQFENVGQAGEWLADNEPGALVRLNGEARFYPLSIMTAHEIVNDRIGDTPVAVTFCPLCNTAIAYDRRVDGEVLRFGVSGLLRKSDLVMWDDATTSLWQQISGVGVVGTYAGTKLEAVSTAIVSFAEFRESFPDSLSLSRNTGLGRSYGLNPYAGYSSLAQPFLFDGEPDPRLPALSRVVGVIEDYGTKAYPFEALSESRVINDTIGGEPLVIFWTAGTADALDKASIADSQAIGSAVAYRPIVDGEALTFIAGEGDTFTDDQTSSTWTITGRAVDGPLAGAELDTVVHKNEFWFAFAGFFPDAGVFGL